jgi:hypothetical protein
MMSRSDPAVDALTITAYTVPTDAPEGDGTLEWDATTIVVVRAHAAGTTGLGWTYAAPATAAVVRDELAASVVGRCAWDVPAANEAMTRAVRNIGRPGLVACAISAVDIALWDLKAHLLDLPLVDLLGAARSDVPVYGSGGFITYDDDRQDRQLRSWVEEYDIPRVKIKIGESWGGREARDLERVAGPGPRSATGRACTSTRTAPTAASRPCGSAAPWPTSTCAGSRNRSPPPTSPAWPRSATRWSPTSPPANTATHCPTSPP